MTAQPAGAARAEGARLRKEAGRGSVVILGGIAAGAISTAALAKLLSLEAFGLYILGTTILNYAVILARSGVESSIVRFLNQHEDPVLIRTFIRWVDRTTVSTSVIVAAVLALVGFFAIGRVEGLNWPILLAAMLGLIPLSSIYVNTAILRAQRRVFWSLMPLRVLRPLLATGIAVLAVWVYSASGIAAVVSEVVAIAIIALLVQRLVVSARRLKPASVQSEQARAWAADARQMTIGEVAQQVVGQVDVLMVGALLGVEAAGLYGLASRLARLVLLGNKAANSVASPVIARSFHAGDHAALQSAVSHTCTIAAVATTIACVALALIPTSLYHWLGAGFADARPLMLILLGAQVVNAVTGPVGIVLVMTGHERLQALVNVISGAALIVGIVVIDALHGQVHHVAVLLGVVIAVSNIVKAVLVYRKTGVLALPFVAAKMSKIVVTKSNRRLYRLWLTFRDIRSRATKIRVARGSLLSAASVEIGFGTRINGPCVAKGTGPLTIGRYCAIGYDVRFITSNHLTNGINLNVALQRRLGASSGIDRERLGIEIGANAWIGDSAIILPGVTVGVGAIVGAGAVVSKSVPAFGVCVGNPGRVIRRRFADDVCDALEQSKWWDLPESELEQYADVFGGESVDLTDSRTQALLTAAMLTHEKAAKPQ